MEKTELVAKQYACTLSLTGQAHLKANVLEPVVYLKREKQKCQGELVSASERQVNLLLSIWVVHNSCCYGTGLVLICKIVPNLLSGLFT